MADVGKAVIPGRTIAIAVDPSEHSKLAVNFYLTKLRVEGDKLIVIHCQEMFNIDQARLHYASGAAFAEMLREEEARVQACASENATLLKDAGVEVLKTRTDWGKPGEVICRVAKEESCDIVVIGTRGQGKLRRTILGSVSDYVVHHSECPVVVCKHPHDKK
ncbi:unnamed protein product [Owenia fusiformis]|uniref:Uncharacterized protein n=1 Tax=Owenia fusiformis TaxID=6347 RepID=A0A8J1XWV2_OWEFU|nr:unnamed protein product [Owenia fusiformis]